MSTMAEPSDGSRKRKRLNSDIKSCSKKVRRSQVFLKKYSQDYPGVVQGSSPHHAFCNTCNLEFSIAHMGAGGEIFLFSIDFDYFDF